ncbi:hypothetical protein K523DRAFT_325593 [Schizophyllum commune Tattone D]|nr:hypothetical protein K523DRAFT_325593 [Schizophyllum commune Tattone D]
MLLVVCDFTATASDYCVTGSFKYLPRRAADTCIPRFLVLFQPSYLARSLLDHLSSKAWKFIANVARKHA